MSLGPRRFSLVVIWDGGVSASFFMGRFWD